MSADFPRDGLAIHATAVAIGGRAILIRGASRSGKSSLAAALLRASTRERPVELVGDDRVILSYRDGSLVVRPHPRTAGFIERRGLGLVAMPFRVEASVLGVIELGDTTTKPDGLQNLPLLPLVNDTHIEHRRNTALLWCDTLVAAAYRSQFAAKWP